MVEDAPDRLGRQIGRGRVLERWQVVHVVVDRLQSVGCRVLQHPVDPAFRLAGKQRAAEVERLLEFR